LSVEAVHESVIEVCATADANSPVGVVGGVVSVEHVAEDWVVVAVVETLPAAS
jgi:hypothetical protein